jgi:Holliday junction resolvasome RuvABC endonuclease subunit
MTKADKSANTKLSQAKSNAKHTGKKLDKVSLGIKGKITKKHLAIRWVNETYNLNLAMKDNDAADAIALASSYLLNAPICDGII